MSERRPTRLFPVGEVSRPGITPSSTSLSRSSNPAPSSSFTSSSSPTLIDVSHRLRPRDYSLASLLDEHTTLTTDQLTDVLFTSAITCRHRLTVLRSFGFVDRFIRRSEPGMPNIVCWVPGPLSARLTALAADQTPPTARALRERQDRIYANPALDHLLEANDFFVRLLAHGRANADTALARWWSERTTAAAFGQRIHPDGHGVWADQNRQIGFFLELDRGTEFSRGRGPCRSPDLRVSAAQRLIWRRYRSRQVWCKQAGSVSPIRVADPDRVSVHAGHCGGAGRAGHGSSVPAAAAWPCDGGVLSRVPGGRASKSAGFRAWCRCRGSARGRCVRRCRDRHPNRPPREPWNPAQGRVAGGTVLLRMTFRGLSFGGGIHA
jgi:hypothetical protein